MMKRFIGPLTVFLAFSILTACSKPSDNSGGKDTPTPPAPPVVVDYVDISDAKFKAYLLDNFDTDKDGRISESEVRKITAIDCSSKGIKSLSGIRCFTELVSLNCSGNDITTLSLSSPATKGSVKEGDCSKLSTLNCSNNKISTIVLDNCPSLSNLDAGSNELTEINVSSSPALVEINLSGNNISSIDVSSNLALKNLNVSGNAIQSIDVTNNPNLTRLDVSGNNISFIDVSDNPKLENLNCKGNENLTEIVVDQGQKVDDIIKTDTPVPTITSIDVTDVVLNYSSAEIQIGETLTLTATISPGNATNKVVSWTSSNPSVVTVDAEGKVLAISLGEATVTVRTQNNNKKSECVVIVSNPTNLENAEEGEHWSW